MKCVYSILSESGNLHYLLISILHLNIILQYESLTAIMLLDGKERLGQSIVQII